MISERNTQKNYTFGNEQYASGREMEFWALKNAGFLSKCWFESYSQGRTCRRIEGMVSILSSIGGNLFLSTRLVI